MGLMGSAHTQASAGGAAHGITRGALGLIAHGAAPFGFRGTTE